VRREWRFSCFSAEVEMALPRIKSFQPARAARELLMGILGTVPVEEDAKPGWYEIRARSESDTEIHIYDEIGYFGVTAADFVRDLGKVSAKNITLRINSPGGDVFDGIAIFNALKAHRATVNVFVDGLAASAASFIAMAGDTVTMMGHSQLMIHDASGLCIGPAEDMRKMADLLDKISDNIASIYAEKAGGTTDEWRDRMRAEMWLSDEEAVDMGLADQISGKEPTAHATTAETPIAIDWGRITSDLQEEAAELVA